MPLPKNPPPVPCAVHGTWICHGCWNWRRHNAVRTDPHICPNCGSRDGAFSDVHHRNGRSCQTEPQGDTLYLTTVAAVDAFVQEAHAGQTDKLGEPYIHHVLAVARGLEPFGPELEMAGLLHDVLEDTGYTARNLLNAGVPERTMLAVVAVTNTPGQTYQEKIRHITGNPDAVLVKIADNAHNSHPDRLAQLPQDTRDRLTVKYTRARQLLWESARPTDIRQIISRVNPNLLELLP